MNHREVMQQVLEVLEDWDSPVALPAIVALKAALAEPQQEPAAKCIENICSEHLGRVEAFEYLPAGTSLYTHPAPQCQPQKPVVNQQMTTEPVAKVELMTTGGNAGLATRIVEIDDHLRERLRPGQMLCIHPAAQRQALTADETMILLNETNGQHWCDEAHIQRFRAAIERRHGIGGQDDTR